jgi:16S rRNA C967 or C1407 C5-methylase (RsmB/RsmF family)
MLEKLFSLGYSKTFAERYYQLWGERALAIAEAMEKSLPRCFRVNTLRIEVPKLTKLLNKKGFQFKRVPWAREGFCLTFRVS